MANKQEDKVESSYDYGAYSWGPWEDDYDEIRSPQSCAVEHTCNSRVREAEAGGLRD
jgi:hypothetical protein